MVDPPDSSNKPLSRSGLSVVYESFGGHKGGSSEPPRTPIRGFRAARLPGQAIRAAEPLRVSVSNNHN